MSPRRFSRREFFAIGGTLAAGALVSTIPLRARPVSAAAPVHMIYRLSLRGRRGSKAAKLHNANMRFATAAAADLHRAHAGDHSRIVGIIVSDSAFQRLFPNPDSEVADLRKVVLGCIGDCDHDKAVTVNELLVMVNEALGNNQVCAAGDANRDNEITVNEILTAVNNALGGCR